MPKPHLTPFQLSPARAFFIAMLCDILGLAHDVDDEKSRLETLKLLKDHILQLQEQCRLLEDELATQNQHVGNIRTLPPEILSIIFGFYLENDPRNVRRLMLVCWQWHSLAINNPQLWTRIDIVPEAYIGDFKGGARGLKPYIKACVERSGTALLRINLDFYGIPCWEEHILDTMTRALQDLFPGLPEETIYDWERGEDWSWCERDIMGDPPGNPKHVIDLLSLLGPKDRWECLDIAYPDNQDLADEISWNISGDMPKLKTLAIREYPRDVGAIELVLTNLVSLTYLKVPAIHYLRIIRPPLSLKHLETGAYLDWEAVTALSRLAELRTLKLLWTYEPIGVGPPEGNHLLLKLPKLRTLHISHSLRSASPIKFELLDLQDLFLLGFSAPALDALPELLPVQIHWTCSWPFSDGQVARGVEKLMTRYPQAQRIVFQQIPKNTVLDAIRRLKNEGRLKSRLEALVFESFEGDNEVISMGDI